MPIEINYKNSTNIKISSNLILFVDEKFNIPTIKNYISKSEYTYIFDLVKTKDLKKKLVVFDISSKKKIILVSLKNNLTNTDAENLGAKFYDIFMESNQNKFILNSDSIPSKLKNFVGYFLHGMRLKSYKFEKYKTKKKSKINFSVNVIGKNITSVKDQVKFNSIEEGTFYTRDLVSEPGNVLHPDEYAKRISTLKKIWAEDYSLRWKKIEKTWHEYTA